MRQCFAIAAMVLTLAACGGSSPPPPKETPVGPVTPPPPGWVNRIWRVTSGSDIPTGALYVFLGDQTLLITSPNATPMVGRWMQNGDGLVMIEEGLSYQTDIVEQSSQRLVLRQHNPGGTVTLVFTPARTGG
jgi:hypothetical protein